AGGTSNAGSAYIFKKNSTGGFEQIQKIMASDRATSDYFGSSVSISEDYAIVGAIYEDPDGVSSAGSAYIFKKNSGTGQFEQIQKVIDENKTINDNFGYSVFISGNYTMIGTPNKDVDGLSNVGIVCVYEKNSTGQFEKFQELTSTYGIYRDYFGYSVFVNGDYLVVGAIGEDTVTSSTGAAYLFEKNSTGSFEFVEKYFNFNGSYNDEFGYSVTMNNDSIVAGAVNKEINGSDVGAVYSFLINEKTSVDLEDTF
ncbi:MAG: hypothetical protein GY870_08040, partial [archaeon]|nr:hypothetical protein [archaeon]